MPQLPAFFFYGCSSSKGAGTTAVTTKTEETYTHNSLTVKADGKIIEWNESLFKTDNTMKIKYAVANNTTHLFVALVCNDRMQQMKMLNGGTQVWIDNKLKKNSNTGVKFPIGGEFMKMPSRSQGQTQPDATQMKEEARNKMRNMELKGFKTEYNGLQSVYSASQVIPAIDWDAQNNLVYELAIPFTALAETDATSLKNISVGIIFKGLKMPEGMPGGGGMPDGMKPLGGGTGMPDMSQMENMTKESSVWTKYTVIK